MRWLWVPALLCACGDNLPRPPTPFCDSWHEWGNSSSHTGASCAAGQPLQRVLAQETIDPFVAQEEVDGSGGLIVHYQAPLIDGDAVFMMTKHGKYTPCANSTPTLRCYSLRDWQRLNSEIWTEVQYGWQNGALVRGWQFESDWKPPPTSAWETLFQPALVGDRIAIPAANGGVWELDAAQGIPLRHDDPFGGDPDTYVAGAIAADWGTIYYNAVKVAYDSPYLLEHSWLVAIRSDGTTTVADYKTLVPGAPAEDDECLDYLNHYMPCGPQVPGFNSAPAFGFDSTLYVVTHAQYATRSFVAAIEPADLTPRWATSLSGILHDGCGITIPYASQLPPNSPMPSCPDGTPAGVDPNTGGPLDAVVDDGSSSSPVTLPNGGVLYGAFTFYNGDRGHLVRLDHDGHFTASYDFGWDTTPAVDGDQIVLKDNHYFNWDNSNGPYNITRLDSQLQPVWQFPSTQTDAMHPHGYEWCINAPAVDRDGTVYANSEDGNLYAVTRDGQLRDRIQLGAALGAAYTPLSIDHAGRIYALNAGKMFVIGSN